ncbi:MAG: hypothetical protein HRT90_00545 [Candidatus Margulisbacteria bacterium]|nr:hypothetical protein [Candidatus Margulisiibacteriota bacterium]
MKKHLFVVFMICLISSQAFAFRVGGGLRTSLGDNPDDVAVSFRLLMNQKIDFLYMDSLLLESSLFVNGLGDVSVGFGKKIKTYGPRHYYLIGGYKVPFGDKTFINSKGGIFYLGGRYDEELTKSIYLMIDVVFHSTGLYDPSNAVRPHLAASLVWYLNPPLEKDSTTRISFLNVEDILNENISLRAGEAKEDLSKQIESFSRLSESVSIDLPKFVKRGESFTVQKEFKEDIRVEKVSVKVEGIPNQLFTMEKAENSNTWKTDILLPKEFEEDKINLRLFVKTTDGLRYEEFATTLVE